MYRAVGTIERNGVGSVDWKTLDFEATEWMGEERRRAMGDTRQVGRASKTSEALGSGEARSICTREATATSGLLPEAREL